MKPDKKIIQQQTELYFNNHKKWYFENLEALEYKEQFIVQEIDRTDSAIKDLEKHLQNPDLRSDDNISYLQGGYKYLEFLKKEYQKYLPPQQTETKMDKLKAELGKYGFFELPKVKQLSEPNKQNLVELISTNDLPYSIAMFEYLGFLKHLRAEHFTTDYKLFKAVARWFGITERAVKGNIYVLNEHSKENRTRYTADQQKQTVQKDYEKLK